MFLLAVYSKALFAGFMNGLYLGRKIRYGNRQKHFPRVQHNSEIESYQDERRIRDSGNVKELDFRMV